VAAAALPCRSLPRPASGCGGLVKSDSSRWLLASRRDGQSDISAGAWVLPAAVTSLAGILAAAPEAYDQALGLPAGNHLLEVAVLVTLIGFIVLLGVGEARRRRWTFWLILVAFWSAWCGCRWPSCSSREAWRPIPHAGMSASIGCWASSRWPSEWPWWRAIVVLASGESTEQIPVPAAPRWVAGTWR
jgi:hypothetical protein